MRLHEITATPGSTKDAKRIGRGHGSGNGKTAGKGHKGQKARAGHGFRPGFEGGQMPLHRRIPKRGFNNIFAVEVTAINVAQLETFEDGTVVTLDSLKEAGIIKNYVENVKVLSNGNITKKLTVQVNSYSEAAKAKIEAAGGKAEVI
ncbi:MAG: 50S ribosomal protein L15 [Clostridia bacterium]